MRLRAIRHIVAALGVLAATMATLAWLQPAHSQAAAPAHVEGILRVRHSDDFDAGRAGFEYEVETDYGEIVPIDFEGDRGERSTQANGRVHLHGDPRGGRLFVPAGGNGSTSDGGAAVAAVSGNRSVLVLLFNFKAAAIDPDPALPIAPATTNAAYPWTIETIHNVMFVNSNGVKAYYTDASDNTVTLTGAVHNKWNTIVADTTACNYSDWATKARNAATADGVNLAAYQNIVYGFPNVSSCGWAGLANLPGSSSWINGYMTNVRVITHELGHNFGVHHAQWYSCTEAGVRVTLSSNTANCTFSEYGDPFTTMGSTGRLHNNWHRAQLGWAINTQTATTTGNYTLAPADDAAAVAPRMIRVARPDGSYLNLEYRQPTGPFDNFGATDPAVSGVSIRLAPNISSVVQTKLLDATPATTGFGDAPLAVGATFTDPTTGVTITTSSAGATGATVHISFVPDVQPPSAPGNLRTTSVTPTSTALAWDTSTDNIGVTGYRVLRGGAQIGTTTALSYTDSTVAHSMQYSYQVIAVDAQGNGSPGSNVLLVTTPAPDNTPPSAPGTINYTVARNRTVSLSWAAATDNVGVVSYRVYNGSTLVQTVGGTSTTDRPGRGTFIYTVQAVDAAGNVGPGVTKSVTVK